MMLPSSSAQARLPSGLEVAALTAALIATIYVCLHLLALPIQLALFAAWFIAIALGLRLGHSYAALQRGLIDGIHSGMEAVLVLIAVGALIGSWILGGIVPSIIYYGLSLMSPQLFLPAAFLICAVTSLATGTSFGTAGTAGIAMIGIGHSFGMPLPLVAGAVISGAYVGDKLSPLSDTTVMTASLCKVDLVEHIKSMLWVSAPAAAGAALLFLAAGLFYAAGDADTARADEVMTALQEQFNIGWPMLLPLAAVIGLLLKRYPSIPVISFGAALGAVWAVLFQQEPPLDAINSTYYGSTLHSETEFLDTLLNRGGIESMLGVIVLVLFALGLGGLMKQIGLLEVICRRFLHWADSPGRLTLSTLLGGFFGNFFGGAAYVSLITASTLTEQNYLRQGIDRRVLSRNTEAGGTITTPMVPWTDGGVFMATTLGVGTLHYLPFLWYHLLVLALSALYGYAGIAIWRGGADEAKPVTPRTAPLYGRDIRSN